MKIEHRDHNGKIERKILIAMIINKVVLGRIAPHWTKEGLFKNKWCNIIGGWCCKFFLKFAKAPGRTIETQYERWARDADKDTQSIIERFLGALSDEYATYKEDIKPDYIIDLASEHFNNVQKLSLAEAIKDSIEGGEAAEADRKINSFVPINLGSSESTDVLLDQAALREAFETRSESILKLPGCLGHFLGDAFQRDSFIGFVAPDKTGKSYWLQWFAWEAMLQRLNVAMFVVGDMSKGQVLKRFAARASGRPVRATKPDKPVRYPKSIMVPSGERYGVVDVIERKFKRELQWGAAWKAFEDVAMTKVKSKKPKLRLSCHPADSISVLGIQNVLQGWERMNWIPDMIVIDYADTLAAINGREETRHQINRTWAALRSLSQSTHSCLITATQANAAAYSTYILGPQHFSESKMKNAYVTAMIGINQSQEEKEMDITRLNFVRLREDEYSVTKCVHVAGCRAIGNIAVKSCY